MKRDDDSRLARLNELFPESLELLASGKIHYPKVATEFSMWDAPKIFQDLNEHPGQVHKGVLMI